MRTAKEYYIGAFSADNLFGFRMIVSVSSLLILLYCIGLAALVWRAKSKEEVSMELYEQPIPMTLKMRGDHVRVIERVE